MARKYGSKRTASAKSIKRNRWSKFKRTFKSRARPAITKIKTKAIPDKMLVKLPYTDVGSYVSTYFNAKSYNINNVWDPEYGTSNNSAYGLAQFAGLYEKYRVYGISYKVDMYNNAANGPVACYVNFAPQNQGISPESPVKWDQRYTVQRVVMPSPVGRTTIKGYMSIPKVLGLTPEQYRTNDSFFGMTNGSNPDTTVQMNVGWRSMDGTSGTNMAVKVQITYHVELFDRADNLISAVRDDAGNVVS